LLLALPKEQNGSPKRTLTLGKLSHVEFEPKPWTCAADTPRLNNRKNLRIITTNISYGQPKTQLAQQSRNASSPESETSDAINDSSLRIRI